MVLKASDKPQAKPQEPKKTGASNNVLIIGESGTGKTASARDLDPQSTAIIRVLGKPLPFKGWKDSYNEGNDNLYTTDKSSDIITIMRNVSDNQPKIKTVVIDDFQYIMCNMFMRGHGKGAGNAVFALYNDIADDAWNLLQESTMLRDDITVVFLSHSEETDKGVTVMKTIGKLLREKITPEGMFTVVLQTVVADGEFKFLTRNNGNNTVKSPMGMFEDEMIPNSLQTVITAINNY